MRLDLIAKKKALRWVFVLLLVGVVGYFFYITLSQNLASLESVRLSLTVEIVVAILLFILAIMVSGVLWGRILSTLTRTRIGNLDAISIHAISWLMKYIPGQAGSYVSKVAWGASRGISKKTISTSFIYENTLTVVASLALSIPVLAIFSEEIGSNASVLIPLLVVVPLGAVFIKPLFYGALNLLSRFTKLKPFKESDFLSSSSLLLSLTGYLIPRIINGFAFLLIASSVVQVEPYMYVGVISSYILAGVVGLLAFFVPSGIGVREAVIVLTLSTYFGVEQAIVLAVVARLYTTIADGLLFLVYIVIKSRQRRLNDR